MLHMTWVVCQPHHPWLCIFISLQYFLATQLSKATYKCFLRTCVLFCAGGPPQTTPTASGAQPSPTPHWCCTTPTAHLVMWQSRRGAAAHAGWWRQCWQATPARCVGDLWYDLQASRDNGQFDTSGEVEKAAFLTCMRYALRRLDGTACTPGELCTSTTICLSLTYVPVGCIAAHPAGCPVLCVGPGPACIPRCCQGPQRIRPPKHPRVTPHGASHKHQQSGGPRNHIC